jgi:hypothetical protein
MLMKSVGAKQMVVESVKNLIHLEENQIAWVIRVAICALENWVLIWGTQLHLELIVAQLLIDSIHFSLATDRLRKSFASLLMAFLFEL